MIWILVWSFPVSFVDHILICVVSTSYLYLFSPPFFLLTCDLHFSYDFSLPSFFVCTLDFGHQCIINANFLCFYHPAFVCLAFGPLFDKLLTMALLALCKYLISSLQQKSSSSSSTSMILLPRFLIHVYYFTNINQLAVFPQLSFLPSVTLMCNKDMKKEKMTKCIYKRVEEKCTLANQVRSALGYSGTSRCYSTSGL